MCKCKHRCPDKLFIWLQDCNFFAQNYFLLHIVFASTLLIKNNKLPSFWLFLYSWFETENRTLGNAEKKRKLLLRFNTERVKRYIQTWETGLRSSLSNFDQGWSGDGQESVCYDKIHTELSSIKDVWLRCRSELLIRSSSNFDGWYNENYIVSLKKLPLSFFE